MVSIDKIQRGVAKYLDIELLPKMQGKDRWIMTSAATLYLAKMPEMLKALNEKPAIKMLSLVSEDGNVDVEALINSVRPAAKQAPLAINIPFGGTLSFSEADLDIIYKYIMQS